MKETKEEWMSRAQVQQIERDCVPPQVAIEMLIAPKAQLSSRERRMFRNSLEKHFVSLLQQKPREEKLAFKLQYSTWAQLNKWLKRTIKRHSAMQKRYSIRAEKVAGYAPNTPEKILGERALAAARVIMGQAQETLDALETEFDRRTALASAADKISTEEVSV